MVIVIGLALFAFIAGDAWKILQPHQGKQNAGEINGNTLSVQDYQQMVDEFSEVIKLTNGLNSLNEDQLTNIKDQVWNTYVTNELIAAEANKPETVDTGSKCNKSRGKSVRAKHTGIYFTGRAGTYGKRGPAVDAGRLAGG